MTKTQFSSILIANRGEIACRIIRTAKAMGLQTIAVYSDADAQAPFVKLADQAVYIGAAPAQESYLVIDRIIEAAKQSGAGAIHPGYGFLSENAAFAKACAKAGLIFIGPKPDAIDLMGDKAKAKRRMIKAGVPCVPGYQGEAQDDAILINESETIGFPIMVKAAAGGGGRGLRLVSRSDALPHAIENARSEAQNAFGSDVLILERALQNPRHVEIQIMADKFGNVIHLGERDCSVQRRHQKVLEEAPCPIMTPKLRKAMGASAVKAAKDIGYIGAGTVEFMLDASGDFFFLEMNTRLQVEHPVTEMITGLDLVAMQIKVAQGDPLGLSQDDITLNGHAIEARLYAEDVGADFLPATGRIDYVAPAIGDGIRIDSGVETGSEISPFYDPMIAKIIGHGTTREAARLKLIHALKNTALFGVKTNQSFLIKALEQEDFITGSATTAFIADNFSKNDLVLTAPTPIESALAAVTQFILSRKTSLESASPIPSPLLNWSSATKIHAAYEYGGTALSVTPIGGYDYTVADGDESYSVGVLNFAKNEARFKVENTQYDVQFFARSPSRLDILINGQTHAFINRLAEFDDPLDAVGEGSITAPMHGALLNIFVGKGDRVTQGTRLAIIEAMKMQHEILADIDGIISDIHVTEGAQIAAHTVMIEIESEAP